MAINNNYNQNRLNQIKEECRYYETMIEKIIISPELTAILHSETKSNNNSPLYKKSLKSIRDYITNKNSYSQDKLQNKTLEEIIYIKDYFKSILNSCRKIITLSQKTITPDLKTHEDMANHMIDTLGLENLVSNDISYRQNLTIYGKPLKVIREFYLSKSNYSTKAKNNTEKKLLVNYYQNVVIACEDMVRLMALLKEYSVSFNEEEYLLK